MLIKYIAVLSILFRYRKVDLIGIITNNSLGKSGCVFIHIYYYL